MASSLRQAFLMPFWMAQVFSQEKFFARNPVIGNRWLNEHGLHTARVTAAYRLSQARRRRLARLIPEDDRRRFDRDGFVVKRDFLPAHIFEALASQSRDLRAPAREMVEGDTVTRHIALDPGVLDRMPAAQHLLGSPEYRNLISYAGSSSAMPMVYLQTILSGARAGPPDPQTDLHTDTFHPTVKAWLFLTDVAADAMPFVYVPGSHRLTPQRLDWERRMAIAASGGPPQNSHKLVRAIAPEMLTGLGLPAPQAIAVPANTLVVADTFGFHARGLSARPTARVEIWAMGRRNPFLPWTGLDPWMLPALGLRKPLIYWKSVDLLARFGLGRQRWLPCGPVSAFDRT
ncbi:MAG TPA: phytanoyl-CoA dioxygenase family protein [Stellaceae bacterium]|nr:phytanoyl-CoA dioxygenase family protein [Stellaceae bacterium]